MSLHPASPAGVAAVPEAEVVAAAVLACPGVVSLHAGGVRQVATYLPGRRVTGVRLDESTIEVALVARFGIPVRETGAQVRAALAPYARGRTVDVHVADIRAPGEADTGAPHEGAPADQQPLVLPLSPEVPGARR